MLYIYNFLVSVDHYPCSNESQFEQEMCASQNTTVYINYQAV